MTLTINLPDEAEALLKEEADKAGLPVDQFAESVLLDRVLPQSKRLDNVIAFFAAIADPDVHLEDVSREAIYAE